jgi:hypothetical protein
VICAGRKSLGHQRGVLSPQMTSTSRLPLTHRLPCQAIMEGGLFATKSSSGGDANGEYFGA